MAVRIALEELLLLLQNLMRDEVAFQLTFSGANKRAGSKYRKLSLRPFASKQGLSWSAALWDGIQETHRTLSSEEVFTLSWLETWLAQFRQLQVNSAEGDYHLFSNSDGSLRLLKRPATREVQIGSHNRQKSYFLQEGEKIPFLIELGVMNSVGKVVKARYDKFRQINRFLEFVSDVYASLPAQGVIRVIDFGCGRSYLTFALHWLLTEHFAREVDIIGLDLKQDVINECQAIQQRLALPGLTFAVGDIAGWRTSEPVDLVVSLHACDTATDAALAQAVRWRSKVILAAPCCQHQLAPQMESEEQRALLRYGIFRERIGALITDALRAAALEALGWSCQVLEFIDLEHTPKNLLLRAVIAPQTKVGANATYQSLKAAWNINAFALEDFLDPEDLRRLGC